MRLSLLAALLLAAPTFAQTSTDLESPLGDRKIIGAHALGDASIDLDGVLDESVWAGADIATGFVQMRPNAGEPATERTEARVVYSGSTVYVGMRMHDTQADQIDTQLGRRDSGLESDWAVVAFDSYNDDRTAFLFQVNAAGVLSDALLFDDVNEDDSWDAVWDAAVTRDDDGWTAEFRIPLSQLRFATGENQSWGVEFGRRHLRTNEQTFWAPLVPELNGIVSQFGTLTDLQGLRAQRQLEIQPYIASSLTRAPGNDLDPFFAENDLDPRVGLDVKYGVTSDITLTATVNPDFGQVEADPAQVNLGGFELFFEERRPFFVEGLDVFSMEPRRYFSNNRPDLLYTRRIGRSPQRGSFVPSGAQDAAGENGTVYTDAPQQSTILGAAKLSGRAGRFSFGVLNAVTGSEYGSFQAIDVNNQLVMDDRALIEPATNYAVGRVRGTFGRTIIGALGTSVVRSTSNPAIDELLPGQAAVAGLDVEHPFGDWVLSGQLAGSLISGSESSIERVQTSFPRVFQRPDADHIDLDASRTSLAGYTGEVNLLKTSGEHWLVGFHGNATSPGFDSNELGFQSRADQVGAGTVLIYNQNQAQGAFQSWGGNAFVGTEWNFNGDRTETFAGGRVFGNFKNFWGANLNGNAWVRTLDDRSTRGGPLMTSPGGARINLNVWTDDRKIVSGYAWTGANRNELGSWFHGIEAGVEIRPSSSLSIRVGPGLNRSHTEQQYVGAFDAPDLDATFGQRYVFGVIDQTTLSIDTRVNWTFTPTLSLQTFVRPFVSRGDYSAFRQLTEARQFELPLYGDGFGSVEQLTSEDGDLSYRVTGADGGTAEFSDPNFTVRALQGNAVLRWEYRPGSSVFAVWQQQRSGSAPDGAFSFDRDVRGLFSDEVTNLFLIKLSYWLG
ncbi:DUF5916 domain-containing protein [Rubrivirga sp.]|uniref:DUF5916 domain-containing protein n=1 Tax=Rubrivirga sp. TaxID=1885344 RepID=UPI003C7791BE